MNNINFNNPWLLLIFIPISLAILIPFFIAIRKENRSHKNVISAIIHLVMALCFVLALSGVYIKRAITKTDIIVLADVSYSSAESYDTIDNYIKNIEKNMPDNSSMSVVCFGYDSELICDFDQKFNTVKNSNVDKKATNISGALKFASTLFRGDTNKEIVVISDGKDTVSKDMVSVVSSLLNDGVRIDAMYIDSNLDKDQEEIQLNQVDYVANTYVDNKERLDVIIQSNLEGSLAQLALKNLTTGVVTYSNQYELIKGYNAVSMDLDTSTAGEFEYELSLVDSYLEEDKSSINNKLSFTQNVVVNGKTLFIASSNDDKNAFDKMYKDEFEIDYYINTNNIPYMVEDLVLYDQIVLSNVDVSKFNNADTFVDNLDTVISTFGKTLFTMGNVYVQSNETKPLNKLAGLLPQNFGNHNSSDKVYALILDVSRSMKFNNHLIKLRAAAKQIIDMLETGTTLIIIGFSGNIITIDQPTEIKNDNKEEIKATLDHLEATQGTAMGDALVYTLDRLKSLPQTRKQCMVISDGLPYTSTGEVGSKDEFALNYAKMYRESGIKLSCMNTNCDDRSAVTLLSKLAMYSFGGYYELRSTNVSDYIIDNVYNDVTETTVENDTFDIKISRPNDKYVTDIGEVEAINGYYYSQKKSNAITVLSTTYKLLVGEDPDTSEEVYANIEVPILARWQFGRGTVISLSTDIANSKWTSSWDENSNGYKVLSSVLSKSKPDEFIDSALDVKISLDGTNSVIEVNAPTVSVDSEFKVVITTPDGIKLERNLVYDSKNFTFTFDTSTLGKYEFEFTYTLGNLEFKKNSVYYVDYTLEYDSFTKYDSIDLDYLVSAGNSVNLDGNISFNNMNDISYYMFDFTPVLITITLVLFLADICVRKLKLQDLAQFFKKQKKEEKK